MLTTILYSLLALDETVATLATQYGPWLYAMLFVVIFAATWVLTRFDRDRGGKASAT